ncbi:MAG: sterol desaturase family protein [Phormidesmis sp.]
MIYFAVTVLGYFAAAGSLYWALYLRPSSQFAADRDRTSVRSDIVLSVLSSGIFAICAAVMTAAYELGHTRIYLRSEQYGFWYLGFSLVLVLILQDAYFYFTHRLSHHPKCYRWLHQGHHHSKNPTPWTAFAFDPAEAMIQALYLIGVTMLIPMHLSVLVAVVMVMTMGALIHHFGVRLFPSSAFGRWLGSWMVGCTHHWLHHRKYTVHYSLYFTFWDRLLGTQYEGYEDILSPSVEPAVEPAVKSVKLAIAEKTAEAGEKGRTVIFPVPFDRAS